ncbi:hypothetical protein CQ018_10385 [Arthrobacter sp. MYb227]|nr:hypothetical protein CQ018_10385 [Arthrobacter sp. MYb227]
MLSGLTEKTLNSLLGKRVLLSLWQWIGGLSVCLFIAAQFEETSAALLIAKIGDFLGMPSGFMKTFHQTNSWLLERQGFFTTITAVTISLAVAFTVFANHIPKNDGALELGPAPATLCVALLLWQSIGFPAPLGVLFGTLMCLAGIGYLARQGLAGERQSIGQSFVLGFISLTMQVLWVPILLFVAFFIRKDSQDV